MRVVKTTPVQAEPGFRLNPFSLPARFEAGQSGSAAPMASVYLDDQVAIVRRRVAGLPLNIKIPVKMYRGVAIRYDVTRDGPATGDLFLVHRDPALHLPLSRGDDPANLSVDWQSWARLFGLPLLVEDETGRLVPARTYLGKLAVLPQRDRRYHAQFAERRPRFLTRRKTGPKGRRAVVAGREIIART